ncbi:MAG: hypothetical protein JW801_00035 [Bacteroidales bacterium]|nr:hypothetical protein [Bacteroidales bacterium]
MNRLLNIAFLLCLCTFSHAQMFLVKQYRGELNISLEIIDDKRIEKGVSTLDEAFVIENEALAMLNIMTDEELTAAESRRFKKMLAKFMEASAKYREGHEIIYSVFNTNCGKFQSEMKKMNHYASGMNKAKYYERKGEQTISRANSIRDVLLEADKPEWIQYKMHEALQLEKLAIRDKGRALQIYQDFPVEYNYGWEDDVSMKELEKFFKNPLVKLPPEDAFKKALPEERKEPEGGKVVFRVQIAAHTVQLQDDYINTFYTGDEEIKEVNEGAWFKYHIGEFESFEEAEQLRISCRVPRAFVVAYQDDKKLTIKEALAIQQANQ